MLLSILVFVGMACVHAKEAASPPEAGRAPQEKGELPPEEPAKPLVIGHRGASGYRPEHTLEAYRLAIEMGADFIEPDIVVTKDGVLVARHENEISETTNVAKVYPRRKSVKKVDGHRIEGWFVEDFTLAELRTLRAKERLPFRDQTRDGLYTIPTLEEILELVRSESARLGRPIGIYPETKHPTYFRSIGLPIEESLLALLRVYGAEHVYIQSFEEANLKMLRPLTKHKLVLLMEETWTQRLKKNPVAFAEIRKYADGVGPFKGMIFNEQLKFIERAHKEGLEVHPWTFRDENQFVLDPFPDMRAELRKALELGVDGVFSDFPDIAVEVRGAMKK